MPSYCNAVACMRGCITAKSATRTPPNLLSKSQTMTHTPPHTHLRARLLTASLLACATLATLLPAHSEASHCSERPARYVLEMHQGWFARQRIAPGMKLRDVGGQLFR